MEYFDIFGDVLISFLASSYDEFAFGQRHCYTPFQSLCYAKLISCRLASYLAYWHESGINLLI